MASIWLATSAWRMRASPHTASACDPVPCGPWWASVGTATRSRSPASGSHRQRSTRSTCSAMRWRSPTCWLSGAPATPRPPRRRRRRRRRPRERERERWRWRCRRAAASPRRSRRRPSRWRTRCRRGSIVRPTSYGAVGARAAGFGPRRAPRRRRTTPPLASAWRSTRRPAPASPPLRDSGCGAPSSLATKSRSRAPAAASLTSRRRRWSSGPSAARCGTESRRSAAKVGTRAPTGPGAGCRATSRASSSPPARLPSRRPWPRP
mmetsp:Transcript_27400/g.64000  ORF Transcript_27400/g.64000 Transcript_27400/m.64000 type:complete len:264 (+) Transcript_27400:1576-2367(+)